MKQSCIVAKVLGSCIGLALMALMTFWAHPAWGGDDLSLPRVGSDVIFEEVGGLVAVEAEHFFRQTQTETRAWYLIAPEMTPQVKPDSDPPHLAGASGGAYLEILPDTRVTSANKLIAGENFSDEPGKLAVVHYQVYFNNPGRYYVWVRAYSVGAEDNGLHVGLDGQWPPSGQRMQWCEGKKTWRWDSKQRTAQEHCGEPYGIYLEIPAPGLHEIQFSLREDGFEFDKFILTAEREFKAPADGGPPARVKSGTVPKPFPAVAEPEPQAKQYPAHWGEPPAIQTRDLRDLPGGYGKGSSTLAQWIQMNLDKDEAAAKEMLLMNAAGFPIEGSGYYLDKGKWLAINPERNKSAQTMQAFPFVSGLYDVVLLTVGEEDGQSTYTVSINDQKVGDFTCPLSPDMYNEGPQYNQTWANVRVEAGDVIKVQSAIASKDGQEFSRARWSALGFRPADQATRAAVAKMGPSRAVTPTPVAIPEAPKVPLVLPRRPDGDGKVTVSGELKQWHKVTLTLDGPFAHEKDNAPNPFTDYNLMVTFTHQSGSPSYKVPGYFAADGDAANSSAEAGTRWRAHLAPDQPGRWNYTVSFTKGKYAALDGGGVAVKPYDGLTGGFTVSATDKTGRDFRGQGRLHYVGGHYLQFAGSKEYFLKAGPDAPETLLGYADFDNTQALKSNVPLKSWQPHAGDWKPGDPSWKAGKGKGLIGALNYLAGKGLNAFSFLTYNAGGDGNNVWPFVSRDDKMHYDCSKLDQWGVVFDHATANGLYLHFKMQETEIDDNRRGQSEGGAGVPESLDGGKLGPERKLYCRQLIARFAHNLALNWNIGEENTQTTEEINAMVDYIAGLDPYHHPIVIHTYPNWQDKVYTPLLGAQSRLTGASLQNSWNQTHQCTLKWVTESTAAGKPWVVANDEQGGADTGVPPDLGYQGYDGKKKDGAAVQTVDDIRQATLWGNLMAGGAGVEYYFGYQLPQSDLVCEDFRSRDQSWDYCRIALDFFRDQKIPFWQMTNADSLIGNPDNSNEKYCLAQADKVYLVYLAKGGTTQLDLSKSTGRFGVQWFNPRSGGALLDGSVKSVTAGGPVSLGSPPVDPVADWLVLIRKD